MNRLLALLAAVVLGGCAPALDGSRIFDGARLDGVLAFTVKDLENAAALAKDRDPEWSSCMTVLAGTVREKQTRLRAIQAEADRPLQERTFGLASAVVLAHLAYQDRGVSPEVRKACAPVAVDVMVFLARVGAIGAPGGGALNFLLPLR